MTSHVESIVVPVDFGNASANAVILAGRLAEACGSLSLQLLHAELIDVPPYFTPEQIETLEREREVALAHAHEYLRTFGQHHTTRAFSTTVVEGPAVDVILQAARGSDLVVMGTHGRRGVSRWWLGSVAERVLRESARPVVVVHEDARPLSGEPLVLVAMNDLVGDPALEAYGRYVATCLGGRWSVTAPGTAPDAVAASGASIVVVRSPWPGDDPLLAQQAEHLLRVCQRPVLFVPRA